MGWVFQNGLNLGTVKPGAGACGADEVDHAAYTALGVEFFEVAGEAR